MNDEPATGALRSTADADPASPRGRGRPFRCAGLVVAGALLLGAGAAGGAVVATRFVGPAADARGDSSSSAGSTFPRPGQGDGGASAGTTTTGGTAATPARSVGVVTISTLLGYENARAAGTGIVLTAAGEILTNNHVIEGSTSIRVTDEITGRTYSATVVGTDATDDVAVLQLQHASGLRIAPLATTAAAIGDAVTAVGNAGGTGDLVAVSGAVTDLQRTITTQAEGSAAAETLHGLIETDAHVVAGDSGGPLLGSDGAVVGIDTAASIGTRQVASYAIPIAAALDIADRIRAGEASSTITIGAPAFLGVEIDGGAGTDGAAVAGVLDGTPAASAGLAAGDVITAVDGAAIRSGDELSTALAAHDVRDTVTVHWIAERGAAHSATVTLISGPAD